MKTLKQHITEKFMIGDDDEFIHEACAQDVVHQPVEDGPVPYFQQGLGEVLSQRIEPGGIAGRKDKAFHRL